MIDLDHFVDWSIPTKKCCYQKRYSVDVTIEAFPGKMTGLPIHNVFSCGGSRSHSLKRHRKVLIDEGGELRVRLQALSQLCPCNLNLAPCCNWFLEQTRVFLFFEFSLGVRKRTCSFTRSSAVSIPHPRTFPAQQPSSLSRHHHEFETLLVLRHVHCSHPTDLHLL